MFVHTPALLAFDLDRDVPSLDPVLQITCTNTRIPYNLRGVVYFSDEHFSAHVITNAGTVWFHDGMLTGSSLLYESQNLATVCTDRAILAVYRRGTPPPPESKRTQICHATHRPSQRKYSKRHVMITLLTIIQDVTQSLFQLVCLGSASYIHLLGIQPEQFVYSRSTGCAPSLQK